MIFRRTLAMILCLCMASTWLPMSAAAEEADPGTIEEQIRAFADSIDQSDAANEAAWDLAWHGVLKNGKSLHVEEDHPLTATLMNAELTQAALVDGCTEIITVMQQQGVDVLYGSGGHNWGNGEYSYYVSLFWDEPTHGDYFTSIICSEYTGDTNDYDSSLEWITGSGNLDIRLEKVEVKENTVIYDAYIIFSDRFDFDNSASSGSISKDLAALLGSILFEPFDWDAAVELRLEVPNICTHTAEKYHWTYDAQEKLLLTDTSDGYSENQAEQLRKEDPNREHYYHKLDREIILWHDNPWVVEYSVKNTTKFALTPVISKDTYTPYLLNYARNFLLVCCRSRGEEDKYYGTALKTKFDYNAEDTYTFRLENVIAEDDSNMIYVTVYNQEQETCVLEATPLNDCYVIRNGSWVLTDTEANTISGLDLSIRYVGNQSYRFDPDAFDLKIWVRGQDEENQSYLTTVVTQPTCTDRGFATYTCSQCGYSYKDGYVPALCHSYEDGHCIRCGAEVDAVRWDIGTASLNGTIDLVMYVFLSEELVNDPETFARFTFRNRVVDIPIAEAEKTVQEDGTVHCGFRCPLFAKQLADQVEVQVMRGETPVGRMVDYSVLEYCQSTLEDGGPEKLLAICKAMLNYGAAAQRIFNYNAENLANATLSEEDQELPTPDLSAYKHSVSGSEAGIMPTQATLTLESEIRIRVYFMLEDGRSIDEYTFTVDGVEVQPVRTADGWYVETTGIPAKRMEEMHEFKVGGLVVRYCALSYANQTITSEEPLEVNMAKALYAYYAAAEAFFG